MRFFDEVENLAETVAPFALRGWAGVHDAIKMDEFAWHGLNGDRANAGCFVNVAKRARGGRLAVADNVAEKNGERFVADQLARHQNGVAEAKRLALARCS